MPTATPVPVVLTFTPAVPTPAKSYLTAAMDGALTVVTCHSVLTGPVWYYWYLNGAYEGRTTSPARSFWLDDAGAQHLVHCIDSDDPDLDVVANAPDIKPPTRTLYWVRSLSEDVAHYRIDQSVDGGAWAQVAIVRHDPRRWDYHHVTDLLDDMTSYAWRIVPVDAYGNAGTPLAIDSELIVRTPDAPHVSATYDAATQRVTVSAA